MCIYYLPIICKIKNNWNAKFLSISLITTKKHSLKYYFYYYFTDYYSTTRQFYEDTLPQKSKHLKLVINYKISIDEQLNSF